LHYDLLFTLFTGLLEAPSFCRH
jgi:hypothetical protein